MTKITEDNKIPCDERCALITQADLPLACPPRDVRIWDAHPRVYLPVEALGKITCPYCGTLYILEDFVQKELR